MDRHSCHQTCANSLTTHVRSHRVSPLHNNCSSCYEQLKRTCAELCSSYQLLRVLLRLLEGSPATFNSRQWYIVLCRSFTNMKISDSQPTPTNKSGCGLRMIVDLQVPLMTVESVILAQCSRYTPRWSFEQPQQDLIS